MHDDPGLIRKHQSKVLHNDYEAERFKAARLQLGRLQKGTAATQMTLLAMDLLDLYGGEKITSTAELLFAVQRDLMELDIRRMEDESHIYRAPSHHSSHRHSL